MQTIVVLDYGMSNLRSVAKALEHVAGAGHRVLVSGAVSDLAAADRVVFPGQGAIGDCMRQILDLGIASVLEECIRTRPFLGICLGLQSLMDSSEEDGGTCGLGMFPGRVARFPRPLLDPATGRRLKVPHMGWNQVMPTRAHPMWHGIPANARFYFVHSYFVEPAVPELVAATTEYGVRFTCAIAAPNVFATQFHPEKSQRAGLQILRNFLAWTGDPD